MNLNEYEEAVLRFIQSQSPSRSEIDTDFSEILDADDIDDILDQLIARKYIKIKNFVPFAYDFGDGLKQATAIDIYELTPIGKNFLANKTANFTSFNNISHSNITHQSSQINQILQINNLPEDVQQMLKELQFAVEKRDKNGIKKALSYLADKSVDVVIALITGGLNLNH